MIDNGHLTDTYEEDPCEGCPYFEDGYCEAPVGIPCPEGDERECHRDYTS